MARGTKGQRHIGIERRQEARERHKEKEARGKEARRKRKAH